MEKIHDFTNHFLIAMPQMEDPNFSKTVTYICEHNEDGALGIIINRPTDVQLHEILGQMEIAIHDDSKISMPVLSGGPVHQERGFVIHRPVGKWKSSFMPSDNIAITTSRDILEAIAIDKGPDDVMITLGYAGWDAGQLEKEILENTWLSCVATEEIIFNTPFNKRWSAAAKLIGINDLAILSGEIGHA